MLAAVERLEQEFALAQQRYYAGLEGIPEEREAEHHRQHYPDLETYAARFLALADSAPRAEAAARALAWIVAFAPDSRPAEAAARRLVAEHVDTKQAADVALFLAYRVRPYAGEVLASIAERTSNAETRAWALCCLGQHRMLLARVAENLGGRLADPARAEEARASFGDAFGWVRGLDPAALEEQAVAALESAAREGRDVVRNGDRVSDVAAAALREIRELAVDKIAPEIEGEDVEGVPMKLSEFRGKVVLLDFWGNW